MVCVMGASGSGKSTLLRAMAGQIAAATRASVLLNGQPLYADLDALKRFIAYIPQDDAFDDHLTIEENLEIAAAIRSPHLSRRDRTRRIEGKLVELGLSERREHDGRQPGEKAALRRRTQAAEYRPRYDFESADVFPLRRADQRPQLKGLASTSSRSSARWRTTRSCSSRFISRRSKLFQMFSKALLLDKGGKLVFYGTPTEMLEYFAAAEHEQHFGTELGGCPACGTTRPEFIFDVLETPLRDLSGDIIYEENSQGQFVPARRFSPDYWRDKYESFRLLQDVKQITVRKSAGSSVNSAPAPHCRTTAAVGDPAIASRSAGATSGRNFARSGGARSSRSCAIAATSS